MGRYNNFIACVECPHCQHSSEIEFQADIGRLEWSRFHLGDKVFGHSPQTQGAPIAPAPGLENTDFWAHAVGICTKCKSDVYARIEIRSNQVDKVIPVQLPSESVAFDYLNEWGTLKRNGDPPDG